MKWIFGGLLIALLSSTHAPAREPGDKAVCGLFRHTPVPVIVRDVPPARLSRAAPQAPPQRAYARQHLGDNVWLLENAFPPHDAWIVKRRPRLFGPPDWRYYRIR